MAIVTDEDPASPGAEVAQITTVELRVFDDLEAAELWASRGTKLPENR